MTTAKHIPTRASLKAALDYDPATGIFRWKHRPDVPPHVNARLAGTEAGSRHPDGHTVYRRIRLKGKLYFAHRLAWLYVTGEWPPALIDHIDDDGSNNRIANLRPATAIENAGNKRMKPNGIGVRGVSFAPESSRRKPFRAEIRLHGKRVHLGRFASLDDARKAYVEASKAAFKEFARTS